MYLSCQIFEISHGTLKLQQILLPLQTKNSKHDRMEEFLTDIHRKKMFINNIQVILLQSERLSEMHFPVNWKPEFQNFFLGCLPWGYLLETVN